MRILSVFCILIAFFCSSLAAQANMMVNGDFEASSSTTVTPTGWTNIGHNDGVIAYSYARTPAYSGLYFYDLGGFGDPTGPAGHGIQQTVATTPGTAYTLTFGLTSEDFSGNSTLEVSIGGITTYLNLTSTGTFLGKPFTTQTINYVATGASTVISFIEFANPSGGNNDPLIDNVIFDVASTSVPEPSTLLLLGSGVVGLIGFRRKWIKG
jgi:hypothetical protein